MKIDNMSFLKKLIGRDAYDQGLDIAEVIIPIATVTLVIVFTLTFFVHWSILSAVLNLITGTSIIFVAYLIGVILLLDRGVPVELSGDHVYGYKFPEKMPPGYSKTKIRGITMIFLAAIAVYISNRYRKYYAFECTTFLVDTDTHTYHLEKCKYAKEAFRLSEMKGYEVDENNYSSCELCREQAEEARATYNSDRLFKR